MAKPKVDPSQAKIIRGELERLTGHHGFHAVRWVWNKLGRALRLRAQLRQEKKRIDAELEKVESILK